MNVISSYPDSRNLAFGKGRFPDNQLVIFDTTLRDGNQTPGGFMTTEQKLVIAKVLREAGVNVIEAGFPMSSLGDFESVKQIAQTVGQGEDAPTIASFARTMKGDIDSAWNAVKDATYPRIHIVGTASNLHLAKKYDQPYGRSREKNLEIIRDSVAYAKALMAISGKSIDVEFSPEDCGRAFWDPNGRENLKAIFETAIAAGATTVNAPDTIGIMNPWQYGEMMRYLTQNVKGANQVTWSTHTHDDLGMAMANTLAGIQNGARQVEVTVNGIGERAGNASLEEVVAWLAYQNKQQLGPPLVKGLTETVQTAALYPLSQLVSQANTLSVGPNKAIVGANAFTHESGMHQDGIVKNPQVYQFLDPADFNRKIEFRLSPQSGKAGLRATAERLGFTISDQAMPETYRRFIALADKVRSVSDEQLTALLTGKSFDEEQPKPAPAKTLWQKFVDSLKKLWPFK